MRCLLGTSNPENGASKCWNATLPTYLHTSSEGRSTYMYMAEPHYNSYCPMSVRRTFWLPSVWPPDQSPRVNGCQGYMTEFHTVCT